MPNKKSQLSFELNEKGVKCLVFREDTCTKTNDGGLNQMRKERKIVWIYPSKNLNRCPVRLVEKYLGLCPVNYTKKPNFYLNTLKLPHPKKWYSREVLGAHKVREVVKELLSSANIDGYFTNHSLRSTGGSRLFQAGVDRKLVKEFTGHRSDAVDCYQITSDKQRESMSKILASNINDIPAETASDTSESIAKQSNECDVPSPKCQCSCNKTDNISTQIAKIVKETVSKNIKEGTTNIKIEIEITN